MARGKRLKGLKISNLIIFLIVVLIMVITLLFSSIYTTGTSSVSLVDAKKYLDNSQAQTDAKGKVTAIYTDENGNQAVDSNGNPIVIPLDENGSEVIDPNFNRNYSAGYYETGSLVLPEGVSNEPEQSDNQTENEQNADENNMPE